MQAFPRGRVPPQEPPKASVWSGMVRRRSGLGAIAVLAAAVAVGAWLWSVYGDRVRSSPAYALTNDAIEVVGIAPWVKTDLKAEALRSASLDGLQSIDDPDTPRRLARAFDMHPWVRQVVKAEVVHPARARIEILCREPVAMVKVSGGLLPVDAEGVVVPSDGFTAEEAAVYPKLLGIASSPQGAAGTAWGDDTVEEGAALAGLLRPEWTALGLTHFQADEGFTSPRRWTLFGSASRFGSEPRKIRFGSAPGRELPGEPSAASKIARLRALGADAVDVDLTEPGEPPADDRARVGERPETVDGKPTDTTRKAATPSS